MELHTTRDTLPSKGDHYIFIFLCVMCIKQISSLPNIKGSEFSEKGTAILLLLCLTRVQILANS